MTRSRGAISRRIIHPDVYAHITTWFAALQARGDHPFGIADIPLLYETDHASDFDRVIVTACDPETQVQRVMARAGATEAEARQRLAAQWPTAEKVARADVVIRTDGTLAGDRSAGGGAVQRAHG